MTDQISDYAWVEDLWRAKEAELRAFARARVGEDHADEVVQNTFEALWRRRDDPPGQPEYWIFTTARLTISSTRRQLARRTEILETFRPPDGMPNPDPGEEAAERDVLMRAFRRLGADDREILTLAARLGYVDELGARELGVSRRAATVRLWRARRRFDKAVAREEP